MKTTVDIGIFAYNEQDRIKDVLLDLSLQSIFQNPDINPRFYLLANGCTDSTIAEARKTVDTLPEDVAETFTLLDLDIKGKSRTWNHFVHTVSKADAEFLLFLDADIRIPQREHIEDMLKLIEQDQEKRVVNSNPVKDISLNKENLNFIEKVIAASSGTLSNYKSSICGQMYLARSSAVKNIHMPAGLPVEDGFLRAMILTDSLTQPEDFRRIDGDADIAHSYQSIRTVRDLINHQTRIVIGSAINAVLFKYIREHPTSADQISTVLASASNDPKWLEHLLQKSLPTRPYGYVPFQFLTKRTKGLFKEKRGLSLKTLTVASLGFGFDLVVYVAASYKMARGSGANHW